jgi:DNA-binding SARP family transcriptional activator
MQLRVLGQLEAGDGVTPLGLGPPKQRAVLARLALDAGRTVRLEQLLDDLWEHDLPRSAPKMVQIYVSQLRKVLPEGRLRTEGGGYRLMLEDGERDLDELDRLRAQARADLAAGDAAAASRHLAEALALWRGPALGDLTEPFAERERARLEEVRLACLEDRIEADVAAGAHGQVIGELEALIGEHPLRERPRAQLMLALYRAGRQAEALAAFREFRRTLDDELALEPSESLRDLEAAMLRQDPALAPPPQPAPETPAPAPALPGREAELAALTEAFSRAGAGRRATVFVSGEPGLGKTALVEAFLARLPAAWVGRGQCVEGRGSDEAYLPFFDALVDLAAGPAGDHAQAVLEAIAPTWIVHLGRPVPASVAQRALGATTQRMLREAVQALEALAERRPVVLVLEDLHWADEATLELLSVLVRRPRPARLMVVGTYRPDEGPVQALAHEACGRRAAEELALAPLDARAVGAALRERFADAVVPPALAGVLHDRCGGNPLFAGLVVDHWVAAQAVVVRDGVVVPAGDVGALAVSVPPTVRASLEVQFERLPDEDRELLEAASVAGDPFTVAEVAAAAERHAADVRRRLESLAGHHRVVERRGQDAFAFAHELHRDVLRDLMGPQRRNRLHRRLGTYLERAPDAAEHATRIALHLIEGGETAGAVRFLRLGADRALARSAHGIGLRHLRRALEIVEGLPRGPTRARSELELLTDIGQAVVGVDGWSAPEAERTLVRARGLADELGDNEPRLTVLLALATLYEVRGDYARADEVVQESVRLAPGGPPGRALESRELVACNLFHQGAFVRALEQADIGAALFERGLDDGSYTTFPATLGDNAGVACHDWAGLALWFLGFPDQALERARHALALAQEPVRRYSLATAQAQLAAVHQCRGEPEEVLLRAQATLEAATEFGYAYRIATARVLRGWARVRLGEPEAGIDDLVGGLAASRATGAFMHDALHLGMLADAYLRLGEPDAALKAVTEALELAERERSGFYLPELYRLQAVTLRRTGAAPADVQAPIDAALALARRQGSRSLELRVTLTQAAFWARIGRAAAGRAAVAAVYSGFTEGLEAPDLRAAAALLGREPAARAGG